MGRKKRHPQMAGGSASAVSLSRPAQALLALRPAESLNRPRRPLSRGFDPASCPATSLVSFRTYRQLSGWSPPPLVIRAFRAHCHQETGTGAPSRGRRRSVVTSTPAVTRRKPVPEACLHNRPSRAQSMLSSAVILDSSYQFILLRNECAQFFLAHARELVGRAVLNLIDPHPQFRSLAQELKSL